jgi:hypothetical protein
MFIVYVLTLHVSGLLLAHHQGCLGLLVHAAISLMQCSCISVCLRTVALYDHAGTMLIDFVSEHLTAALLRHRHLRTDLRFRFSASGHITTASVTRHLAARQSHILQELDVKIYVAEEKREK